MTFAPKTCPTCGREFAWRKKWERNWAEVKYCSDACRRGVNRVDARLEAEILRLLSERKRGDTICPSEVARSVGGDDETHWRPLMEPARQAARRLVAAGRVQITQKGKVVDPTAVRGPIRVRLKLL